MRADFIGEQEIESETERGEQERCRVELDGRETSRVRQEAVDDAHKNVDYEADADDGDRVIGRDQVVFVHRLEMNDGREHAHEEEEIRGEHERETETVPSDVEGVRVSNDRAQRIRLRHG